MCPNEQLSYLENKRQAEAAYRKAQGAATVARANQERAEKLELVLSARERQDIAAAHDAAEADLVAAKGVYESLAALESRSDRTTIKAPIDGVIVSVGALSGNAVAKDALLIRVVNLKKLWVVGQAYENQLDALASARDGWVEVPALRKRYQAKLISRAYAIDPATRAATVYFEIVDPDGALVPELSVTVHAESGKPEETLAVPRAAVVDVDGRRVVFVHIAPEQFQARAVETGWEDGGAIEIVNGLTEGDRVVVKGNGELRVAATGRR